LQDDDDDDVDFCFSEGDFSSFSFWILLFVLCNYSFIGNINLVAPKGKNWWHESVIVVHSFQHCKHSFFKEHIYSSNLHITTPLRMHLIVIDKISLPNSKYAIHTCKTFFKEIFVRNTVFEIPFSFSISTQGRGQYCSCWLNMRFGTCTWKF